MFPKGSEAERLLTLLRSFKSYDSGWDAKKDDDGDLQFSHDEDCVMVAYFGVDKEGNVGGFYVEQ